MSKTTDYVAYRYRYAMRECQWVALYLYQAFRAEPSQSGLRMLQVTSALLQEVTQKAKQVPEPPFTVAMLQVDRDGIEVRRSIGP